MAIKGQQGSFFPCFVSLRLNTQAAVVSGDAQGNTLTGFLSQNHRTAEIGRDLWRPSRPPLSKAGSLLSVTQESIQVRLEYLQGRLH